MMRADRSRIVGLTTGAVMLVLAGCAGEEIEYHEVKRPDEAIRTSEWQSFVRIVDRLPEPKLQHVADLYRPLPQWQEARTLPVDELATEERKSLSSAWDPAELSHHLSRTRGLARLVADEKMTVEQFLGLTLTIGAAMRRAALPEDYPLDDVVRRGHAAVNELLKDQRLFASLTDEERHRVLDEAVWLHRVDRAERLSQVPGENVALVKRHAEWLRQVMPAAFNQHPFADVVNLLEEQGLPFVELPESGSDVEIEWNPSDAIVGR